MFIIGGFLYNDLPKEVPTHWNFQGVVDDTGSKTWATWLIPGISLLMLILFPLLAKIDPKKKNYKNFKDSWEHMQTIMILFFAYIYGITMYITINPTSGNLIGELMMSGIGVLFIILGLLMRKIKQNYFVGIKTPWTLEDTKVWDKTHEFGGWAFAAAGLIFLVNAWLQVQFTITFIIVITGIILAPIVYSYLISKKQK